MFDEGHLKGDTKQAAIQLENLMNVMKTNTPNPLAPVEDPLLEVFKKVWYRIAEVSQFLHNRSTLRVLTLPSVRQKVLHTYIKS